MDLFLFSAMSERQDFENKRLFLHLIRQHRSIHSPDTPDHKGCFSALF
jgi:hypothetical protein